MGIRLIYVILEIEWFHQYTVVARLILHLLTCQGMGHRWWHERIIAFFTRTSHDDSPIEAFFMVSNYKHLKAGELNTYKTDVPGHAICIYVYTHVHTIQTHTIYYTYTIRILYVYITGAIHTLYVDIRRYTLIYTGIHYPSIHPSINDTPLQTLDFSSKVIDSCKAWGVQQIWIRWAEVVTVWSHIIGIIWDYPPVVKRGNGKTIISGGF